MMRGRLAGSDRVSHISLGVMEKALNFADNQVLRNYGFVHVDLLNSSFVSNLQLQKSEITKI
ncbi:hypothetical protein ACSBR2_009804 [Camellia fascicularis]